MTIENTANPFGQMSRSESQKTIALWEKERNQIINHYENELQNLKQQLEGKRLSGSQSSNNEGLANSKKLFLGGL
jgi:hypothetical protein